MAESDLVPVNRPVVAAIPASGSTPWLAPSLVTLAVSVWFFGFQERYAVDRSHSAVEWLISAWNESNDFEHGPLFPLIIAGLLFHRFKDLKSHAGPGDIKGLLAVFVGVLMYAAAYRTFQPRVAVAAIPVFLWGSAWYLWGYELAKRLVLPFFFFWLAIPVPAFQQATTEMQIFATKMAHHGSALFGVETIVHGTEISSPDGKWEPLEIAKGCSGIRSLMALFMISGAWACATDMALWKRAVLFLSAVPLAVLGNSLRVISIFVIGEYGDADWARNTWHDWSGLLLFYPISLFLMLCLHSLLEGGLPWRKGRRKTLRRVVVARQEEAKPFISGS